MLGMANKETGVDGLRFTKNIKYFYSEYLGNMRYLNILRVSKIKYLINLI